MPQTLKILFPWDGDFVNSRDGEWKDSLQNYPGLG